MNPFQSDTGTTADGVLTDKVALVLGATGGIGKAIATALHAQGATVCLSGTRAAVLDEVKAALGERAHAVTCNLSDPADVEKLVPAAEEAMGGLDILVNNAGVTGDGLLFRMRIADWDRVLDTNLKGTFLCTKAFARGMTRRRWGRVINVTSVVGIMGNAGQANYAASKAGVIGLTKSLAKEFAARGVRVNAIAPGWIETDMTAPVRSEQMQAMNDEIVSRTPAGRWGQPEEVAGAAVFLASQASDFVTGETIRVDGGYAIR